MEQPLHTTIFYADDDIDDLDFFKEVATEINKPVSLFEQGEKLLHTLLNPPPKASVIFLDLNMPIKSGFDILNEIKARPDLMNIPVIILTTSINQEDISKSKELGANLYIRKPNSIDALKKAVNHVLAIDWNNYTTTEKDFFYQPS